MEEQEQVHSHQESSPSVRDSEQTTSFTDSTLPLTADSPTAKASRTSVPTLRFPTPEGSQHLATWVSSSLPDIMPPAPVAPLSDDSNSLSDSAYEIISSVDGESQDGRHTESLTDSLELYPQGDDIRSLVANTPTHDDDTESEYTDEAAGEDNDEDEGDVSAEEQSRSNSIRYADSALQSPSVYEDLTLNNSGTPMVGSIELEEHEETARHDTVIGKHAVKEYSEEETAELANKLNIVDPPKQMIASISQAMSTFLLSPREPLRILYVGSDAARTEIMHKISSAILASDSARVPRNSDGKFNIVRISSFGSDKIPEADEIQLMGVSDYYIDVCVCASAEEIIPQGASHHDDATYSITTEGGKTYTSSGNLYLPGGAIQPEWRLPHLAIFYLSGNDDEESEKATHAAWEFMTRHGVPSLFITHTKLQPTLKSWRWQEFIDQGAVHMVLESRDQEQGFSILRCPVDLETFMSIDARQMNRNLAYLTGRLMKSSDGGKRLQSRKLARLRTLIRSSPAGPMLDYLRYMALETRESIAALEKGDERQPVKDRIQRVYAISRLLNHVPLLALSLLVYALVHTLALNGLTPAPRMATNQELITTESAVPTCAVPTLIPTVTINVVSTKTVHLGVDETTHIFGGFLSDKAASSVPQTDPEPKKVSCSIEIYSGNEILVKIPSRKAKSAWLAAGAIDIDVWRGKEVLKSKLSSTDEGIMIEIPKKEAYGVMNVSVVARKPKVNETFAINFGRSSFTEAFEAGMTMFYDAMKKAFETSEALKPVGEAFQAFDNTCYSLADSWCQSAMSWTEQMEKACGAARKTWTEQMEKARDATRKRAQEAFDSAKREKLSETVQDARVQIHRAQERFVDGFEYSLRRAQIVSKLWWLKAKGDQAEHERYGKKARELMDKMERVMKLKREQFEKRDDPGVRRQGRRAVLRAKTCRLYTAWDWAW